MQAGSDQGERDSLIAINDRQLGLPPDQYQGVIAMADTYYAWDPEFDCITKETDAAGVVIVRYTQEPKPYGGLISQHRSGVSNFYHYDSIGTTRVLTDSSQSVTDTAVYLAFGENKGAGGIDH